MQVKFLKKFSKDLDKITQPQDRKSLLALIQLAKDVKEFTGVPGIKKLQVLMMHTEFDVETIGLVYSLMAN